jgi:hypothetical protein
MRTYGFFPISSAVNHSCAPNTQWVDLDPFSKARRYGFVATRKIEKGEQVSFLRLCEDGRLMTLYLDSCQLFE